MVSHAVFAAALTSALLQYAAAIDGNYIVLANRNSGGGVSPSLAPISRVFSSHSSHRAWFTIAIGTIRRRPDVGDERGRLPRDMHRRPAVQ